MSADLSIVDVDIPFSFVFCVGATTNAYANLTVLAVVTWQVLFVSIPMILLAIRLQVSLDRYMEFMFLTQQNEIFAVCNEILPKLTNQRVNFGPRH